MPIVHKELSYFFSSSVKNGALNVSGNGDRFSVQLNNPIALPIEAIHATLEVVSATIWNNVFNISQAIGNNRLYVTTGENNIVIVIPDGLYGVPELVTVFKREFVNQGQPADLLIFSSDAATQKIVIESPYAATTADFTQANNCREILGFNARIVPSLPGEPTGAGWEVYGDSVAEFNRTNSFLIKSDIISNGIPVNSISDGTIAEVLIVARPGSQINYAPYHPTRSNATELIGRSKNFFTFRLTDQLGREVETNGEDWSFEVVLRYQILHNKSTPLVSARSQ